VARKLLIGLGSNLGDRESNISKAIALLEKGGLVTGARSSLYMTEPEEGAGGGYFLNGAATFHVNSLSPKEILELSRRAEEALGRTTKGNLAPRLIDVDLLLLDDLVIDEEGLKIPHPRLHKRFFALAPAVEIEPGWIHPQLGLSLSELLEKLRADKG
jgi:2-amino-4-hydroxy-6-hydroxymethyldihydropteridine diphosphokinase